ncbi:ribosome maturation factor RimP [Aliihoeflea sp. 2WW]|uniref:ribosome maturation factor RimP n=1 Tax=Aliihoeflea sp. 2WW TaxID=1381123 RepID=UPI000464AACD|nr:ribosome maturation factor RimP [Aliihoeflea sp. 2WW]
MSETGTSKPSGDDRIIRETGIDARIAQIIEPVMRSMGYQLVRVRLSGQNGLTLQIMAERFDGTMTVEDCEEVSRAVSPVLDVEDPIEKAYHLEVSSPGIDRPMVRKSDFVLAKGHLAKIETSLMVAGRKRFKGKIVEADENGITLESDQLSYGEEPVARIPYDALGDAKLILTDDLIRETLKRDKAAKKARKLDDDVEIEGDGPDADNDN